MAAASAVGLTLSDRALAAPIAGASQGTVSGPLRSAGALTFGPDNVLFIGDMVGAAVHAFSLRKSDITLQTDIPLGNFHNFEGCDPVHDVDRKLAALFGMTPDKIVLNDMAVHQSS